MYCYKCGASINDDSVFCKYCGAKQNTTAEGNNLATEPVISKDAPLNDGDYDKSTDITSNVLAKKTKNKRVVISILAVLITVVIVCVSLLLGRNTGTKNTDPLDNIEQTDSSQSDGIMDDDNQSQDTQVSEITLDTVHMSKDNMRPVLIETPEIVARFNRFSYANGKSVFGLNFILENNSTNDISIVLKDVTINGFDIPTSQGTTMVEPGHKANCDSSVWQKEIDKTGVSEWDVINGVIVVRKDYYGDTLYSIPVIIDKACWEYEEEYEKNNPTKPVSVTDIENAPDDAIVLSINNLYPTLVDENGIKLTINSYGYANSKTVFKVNLFLENNSDKDLTVSLSDVVINGFDISTSTDLTKIEPGHKAISDASVWLKEMKEVGIYDWSVLQGTVVIREGFWGDSLYSIPVVIYKNAWESVK